MFPNPLLEIAKKVLEGVLSSLIKQLNVVDELAKAPLKAIVQAVLNGAWEGESADALVRKINDEVLTGAENVTTIISDTHNKIQRALERLEQADTEGAKQVQELASQFEAVA